jgi:hypothetical protein
MQAEPQKVVAFLKRFGVKQAAHLFTILSAHGKMLINLLFQLVMIGVMDGNFRNAIEFLLVVTHCQNNKSSLFCSIAGNGRRIPAVFPIKSFGGGFEPYRCNTRMLK